MNSSKKIGTLFALAAVAAISTAQTYRIIDISAGSPFPDAFAYGISPSGLITGTGTDPVTTELHAFIYQNGVFQDLGDFGYPYGADGDKINDSAMVAATGYGPGYNALLYHNGVVTRLGNIDGGSTVGLAINSRGDVVGRGVNGDGGGQGFSYIGGHFAAMNVDLARGINDSDEIVGSIGYYWVYGGYGHTAEHAFVDIGGTITDIGNLGGGVRTNTEAYDVNNAGQVTGYSTLADGTVHAFLYSNGSMADLGTFAPFYTYGQSVNNLGQVAGSIETYVGGPEGIFLYTNGALYNLQNILDSSGAGWSDLTLGQINDHGCIVGYGTLNGGSHGFLAQPYSVDLPTSYSIYRGFYSSGSLSSLFAVDGNYLVIENGLTLNPSEPPASVIVNGTAAESSPTDLRLTITAHANTTGLSQSIEMWDYVASAWVTIGSQAATTVDSTQTVIAANPARFVQAGTNAVSARVSWKQSGPTSLAHWLVSIDQVVWNDSP